MAEIIRTAFPQSISRMPRSGRFSETPDAVHSETLARIEQLTGYSKLVNDENLALIRDNIHTLKELSGEKGDIYHTLKITDLLLKKNEDGDRWLESPNLAKELSYLAVGIEGKAAIWGLVKVGWGEARNRKLASLDRYVNGLARPLTDMARWISGRAKIDKRSLTKGLIKGSTLLAASSAIIYSAFTYPPTNQPEIEMLRNAVILLAGIGIPHVYSLPWFDLRRNITHSPGEEIYLLTGVVDVPPVKFKG